MFNFVTYLWPSVLGLWPFADTEVPAPSGYTFWKTPSPQTSYNFWDSVEPEQMSYNFWDSVEPTQTSYNMWSESVLDELLVPVIGVVKQMELPLMMFCLYFMALISTLYDKHSGRKLLYVSVELILRLLLLGYLLHIHLDHPSLYTDYANYVMMITLPSDIYAFWILFSRGCYKPISRLVCSKPISRLVCSKPISILVCYEPISRLVCYKPISRLLCYEPISRLVSCFMIGSDECGGKPPVNNKPHVNVCYQREVTKSEQTYLRRPNSTKSATDISIGSNKHIHVVSRSLGHIDDGEVLIYKFKMPQEDVSINKNPPRGSATRISPRGDIIMNSNSEPKAHIKKDILLTPKSKDVLIQPSNLVDSTIDTAIYIPTMITPKPATSSKSFMMFLPPLLLTIAFMNPRQAKVAANAIIIGHILDPMLITLAPGTVAAICAKLKSVIYGNDQGLDQKGNQGLSVAPIKDNIKDRHDSGDHICL